MRKGKSLKQKCLEAEVNYDRTRQIRLRHNLTDDEAIQYMITGELPPSIVELIQKCKELNLNYEDVIIYKKKYNINNDIAIQHALKGGRIKEWSLLQKCARASVDYNSTKYYRRVYNLTDEEAIEYVINKEKEKELKKLEKQNKVKTFKSRCEDIGVNYDKACNFKSKYKLEDDQAIVVALLKI